MKKSLASLWLLAVFTLLLGGCGESGKTTEEYITRAQGYQEEGDYKAAIIELKNALRQSPDNAEARMLIGLVYLESGDGASAEKELLRSIELGLAPQKLSIPLSRALLSQRKFQEVLDVEVDASSLPQDEQVTVALLRGHAKLGLGELDAADAFYDEALALAPETPDALLGKAHAEAGRGNLGAARELAQSLTESYENFAPGWSFLADTEQYLGNIQVAETSYTRALDIRPNNVADLANRAIVRIATGDVKGARSDVNMAAREISQQGGRHALISYARGQLSLLAKNYENATKQFTETTELAPDFLPARYFLAVSQYEMGQLEQAEQNLGKFRYKAPQFIGGHRLFAAIKYSQGDYDTAQEELENLLSFNPGDTWALNLLADISAISGNPNQSIENYRKIVSLQPDSPQARVNLAVSLMNSETGSARQLLQEVAETDDSSVQAKLLLIVSYMKAGEWNEAVAAGEKLVAEDPENWDAFTLLGGSYLGQGNVEKARENFEHALDLNPGNPNAANNLARQELKAGNKAAARQLYRKVLELYPSEATSLLALSSLEFSDGNIEESVKLLEKGLQRSPQDISLRLALARLYLRTGQPSRNINLVYEAPEEQGEHPLMLQVLGDSQYALGEFGAAAGTYEKVLRQVPDSLTGHYLLARTYAANNQLELAKKHLEKVIELEPQNLAASVMQIRILRLERKEQEAIDLLQGLDPVYQDRPEILVEKGWLAVYQKQYEQAISAFERAFEQAPSNALVVQLGIAKWNSGDETGALEGYKAWLQANPDDIQIMFHLANGYLQLGRNKEAIATFEQLLEKTPDDPILMNNLAWLLRESNPERALQLAQKTTTIAPEWGSGIDTLGMIYLEKGDTAEAYRYFEQALKQAPDDPEIRYHVALASSMLGEKEQARQILKAILADPKQTFDSRKDAEELQATLKN